VRPENTENDGRFLSNRTHAGRWQADFPFGWDADDLISRRQLLRLAVMASGALFAATAGLAGLGFARDRKRGGTQEIVNANDVPVGGVHYFNYPGENDHAILLRLPDERFVAYSGKCTHLSCAVYWNQDMGKLRCPCHEGIFEPETGDVLAGPPTRPLPKIALKQEGDTLYAVEEVAE
jgi:nitrite reductase/ring-hydroxylating ferredoxin subunit